VAEGPLKRLLEYKLRKQLHYEGDMVYHFGLEHTRGMEEWHTGIGFLDDWSYLDSYTGKWSGLTFFRMVPWVRYTQWTVHYRFR
jgi:hypothetical protein